MFLWLVMKIFLIGSNGFLGKKLTGLPHEIFTTTHAAMDVCDASDVKHFFRRAAPEVAILAAAFTDVDGCEKDRRKAYDINVAGTKNIVEACVQHKTKLVFFSTDYVFDGEKGNYTEEEKSNPQSHYGKTKLWAEEAIKDSCVDFIIERVSVLYGYNDAHDKQTFEKWVTESLKAKKEIRVVSDQFSCPTLIDDIARATNVLLERGESGVFHVVGSECLSRYHFALNIADVFGFDKNLITPILTEELAQPAPRPKNSCLSTEKIKKRGIEMSDTKTGLKTMKRCMDKTPLNIYPKDYNPEES